jgi:Na+/proline symporter
MWAAPLILPNLADPSQSYVLLSKQFLPAGLVGLVLASMFAATMAMTTSDTNTISSVITRDILPITFARFRGMDQRRSLRVARATTLLFTFLTLVVGLEAERFGGVLGLVILWFGALIGPMSVPMMFGLLPAYRHADARAAIGSIAAGVAAFVLMTYVLGASQGARVLAPIATSFTVFTLIAWLNRGRPVPSAVDELLRRVSSDDANTRKRSPQSSPLPS